MKIVLWITVVFVVIQGFGLIVISLNSLLDGHKIWMSLIPAVFGLLLFRAAWVIHRAFLKRKRP